MVRSKKNDVTNIYIWCMHVEMGAIVVDAKTGVAKETLLKERSERGGR